MILEGVNLRLGHIHELSANAPSGSLISSKIRNPNIKPNISAIPSKYEAVTYKTKLKNKGNNIRRINKDGCQRTSHNDAIPRQI